MRTVASLLAALLLACLRAGAAEPTESTTLPASEAARTTTQPEKVPLPEQHTVVRGTPPPDRDVVGRWLAVGWIELPGGRMISNPSFLEIEREGGQLVLTVRFVALLPAQQKELNDANGAERAWRPSPADIAQLTGAWNTLPPSEPQLLRIDNEIVARDGFDESFTREATTRDAAWVVRQREIYHPSASPAMQTINVYAVLEPREGGFFGNYTTATIAAAPLPIPIALNGTFQMYRLDSGAAPRGLLGRLADIFRGCGR